MSRPEDWQPLADSINAVARLTQANYRVVVIAPLSAGNASNTIDIQNRIHDRMNRLAQEGGGIIEAIFFSTHYGPEGISVPTYRATLEQISQRLKMPLTMLAVVSDTWDELHIARTLGAHSLFVGSPCDSQENALEQPSDPLGPPTLRFDDLAAVVAHLIDQAT